MYYVKINNNPVLLTPHKGLYLFIIVKGHELDGSVGKYSDHHCPVTLVQAKIAFFLWHSLESGEHSCKKKRKKADVSLNDAKTGDNRHFMASNVWRRCPTKMFVMWILGLEQNLDSVQRSNSGLGTASCNAWGETEIRGSNTCELIGYSYYQFI